VQLKFKEGMDVLGYESIGMGDFFDEMCGLNAKDEVSKSSDHL
jgi:hypothetical protein